MLSFVNSSHPSCSNTSKEIDPSSDVSHDVRAHLSNFSIRKYVFKSRSKDIRSNWPFREQLLQLCIDNGINDILPPLEASSSIMKAGYSLKDKKVVSNEGASKNKANELDSSSTLDSFVVLSSSKEHLKSKCGSKVLDSNNMSTSISSKACPVCKTFTSSSNTTLNAHIDQCLSSTKSTMTREEARLILRPKVNAQKKRLIVDIYKTAKICTLEDLDLRNGTNWAATLAVTMPINSVNHTNDATNHPNDVIPANDVINHANDVAHVNDVTHGKDSDVPHANDVLHANDGIYGNASNDSAKGMRFGTKKTVPQVNNAREGNVGDIYVDSNGTKLLILSKCSDSSPVISCKNVKMKKHLKDLCKNKMSCQPSSTKFLKNTILRRKINLDKELDPKDVAEKELHSNEAYDEEKEWDEGNNSEPLKLGHWVRSKRSNLSRKHPGKINSNEGSKVTAVTSNKKTSNDCAQQTSDNSNIKKSLLLNHSKSFKTAAPPKFKAMKVICSTLNEWDSRNTSFGSANMVSHPSNLETFSSKEGDLPKTCMNKPVNFFMGKTYKKRRSVLRCRNRRVGENDSNIVNNGSNDCTNNFEHGTVHSSIYSKYQEKGIHSVVALNKDTEFSISRDESQVELPIYNDEDATNNEVVNRDIQQSVTQLKIMEHHGECRTNTYSFRDPNLYVTSDGDTENIQENSSTTSIKTIPNDQDCSLFVELESSLSRVSTTSTLSPLSPKADDKIKDYVFREDHNNAKVYPKESSCSCSEITNSNQFVKLPSFSSVESSLESRYETVNVTQNQSTPNPILRLMGKDLVVSKQSSICDTKEKFISMGTFNEAGFRSYNNNNNRYQHNPIQAYSHDHQIPVQQDHISQLPVQPQYHAQEMINFNNICNGDAMRNFTTTPPQNFQSSNVTMPQRVFSCYPSQNLYAPEVFTSKQRETTEGTAHVFHSPSSLYFAPVLR